MEQKLPCVLYSCFQLQGGGASPPDPLPGAVPLDPAGALPTDPIIGSRSRARHGRTNLKTAATPLQYT